MGRTLLIMALALAALVAPATSQELCDCITTFVESGACTAEDPSSIAEYFAVACGPHNCGELNPPPLEDFQDACFPCPEPYVRDCTDRTLCWPSKVKEDAVKDCDPNNERRYGVDLSCHSFGLEECPLPEGCDGVEGSGLVVDECGICGGNGQSCSCEGGDCHVLLTIDEESLTQTSATINHCSDDHWRGYQFTLSGVTLTNWVSAIHEMYTQCSPSSGVCLGFGYTETYGYSAHHVIKNKPDGYEAMVSCKSPLVHIEFHPADDSVGSSIGIGDVVIGSDYFELVSGARSDVVPLPHPHVKFYWKEVGMEHANLYIATDTTLASVSIKLSFGAGFDHGSGYDASAVSFSFPPVVAHCESEDSFSKGVVNCHSTGGAYATLDFLFAGFQLPPVVDPATATIDVEITELTDVFNGDSDSHISYDKELPEQLLVPTVDVSLHYHEEGLHVGIRSREDVRGCQFTLRGVDVVHFETDVGVVYAREHADEMKFLVFDMGQGASNPSGYIAEANHDTIILSIQIPDQKFQTGAAMLRDVRCSSDTDRMGVATQHHESIHRCDTKWDGLCDDHDADGDGCPNIDDFSPEDDSAGCGACGDVSADGNVDILDIVMAVKHVAEGSFNTIADTDVDGDNEQQDVLLLRSWVIDPLDFHPALPYCETGP